MDNQEIECKVPEELLEANLSAVEALGEIAANTGPSFAPYYTAARKALIYKANHHWHGPVKGAIAEVVPCLVKATFVIYDDGKTIEWKKGDFGTEDPCSAKSLSECTVLLNQLGSWLDDRDKTAVAKVCHSIGRVVEVVGPSVAEGTVTFIMGKIVRLVLGEANCKLYEEEEEELEANEIEEYFYATLRLMETYSKVMGPVLSEDNRNKVLEALCKVCTPTNRNCTDTLATLGELVAHSEGMGSDRWGDLLCPMILKVLTESHESEDMRLRRNASYVLGVFGKAFGEKIADSCPRLLEALLPLVSTENLYDKMNEDDKKDKDEIVEASASVDNAASALCVLILTVPNKVPLGEALPKLLEVLPLRVDMNENEVVYKCLLTLLDQKEPELLRHRSKLQRILEDATAKGSKVQEGIQKQQKAALETLRQMP